MEREHGRSAAAVAGTHDPNPRDLRDLRRLPVRDLVAELAGKASLLARKEVELAKEELRADVRAEIKMASGLGVAGVCAIITLTLLLVAIAFAFMESGALPGWLATLIVAAVVLAIGTVAGLWGWAKRVRQPLATTRESMKENVRWAKDRIA
ncbi:MAG TPA: phage holin family protein [Anaeromyxobacteraceae bacterium]|nr:phage holin family protein [Anaeromyxobacteraceae bacterium]